MTFWEEAAVWWLAGAPWSICGGPSGSPFWDLRDAVLSNLLGFKKVFWVIIWHYVLRWCGVIDPFMLSSRFGSRARSWASVEWSATSAALVPPYTHDRAWIDWRPYTFSWVFVAQQISLSVIPSSVVRNIVVLGGLLLRVKTRHDCD